MSGRTPGRRAAASTTRNRGFVLGNVVALAVTNAVATTTLWPIYHSSAFVVVVGVTIVLGASVAVLGAVFRWPSWAVALATLVIFLLAGAPLAVPGQSIGGILPTADGVRDLIVATALGWKQLVTIVLPVGDYQALLVPAFILVLLASVIGLTTALRARHPDYAVLAPLALCVGGIALGPTVPAASIEIGVAVFVSVLSWLLWLRWHRRHTSGRAVAPPASRTSESALDRRLNAARQLASAAIIVAVAIAVGTAASIAAPASAPRDVIRARVQQPFDPRDYTSPLTEFRNYLQADLADTDMLRVSGLPDSAWIRLATLDTYDGIVYSVGDNDTDSASGSFTRLPFRLDQASVSGDQATLTVQVDGYSGVWVPGAGALERIQFSGPTASARADAFFYNDNSRTGAVLGGLHEGDEYRAESVVPLVADSLDALAPGPAVLPPLDVVPDQVSQTLARWVRENQSPGEQLEDMVAALRTEGYVSHGIDPDEPFSRSGHGADRITQLLTDRPMVGDAEQYAVTAALMARVIGFPARVVMGFVPGAGSADADSTDAGGADADSTGAAGTVTVTGSDISAWIEVQDADGSWVSIDPNPVVRDIPDKQPDLPTEVSRPQSVVPPPVEEPNQQNNAAQPESSELDPAPITDQFLAMLFMVLRVLGWVVLGLALLLSPFIAVIVGKARRRRLRARTGTPQERIAGGWREFADQAIDSGIDAPASATRIEFAEHIGGMRPLGLATFVDRAVFAPDEPTAADADSVWASVGELGTALTARLSRWQRIRALVSLRSFGRYAGHAGTGRQRS